jgi:tetratricopeptide (TPR) repeat protein
LKKKTLNNIIMRKPFIKKCLFIFILGISIYTVYKTQTSLDQYRKILFIDKRPVFLPNGEVLKWMSLGYRGAVSDWLWIKSVIYYGRRVMEHDNPYYVYMLEKGNAEEELKDYKPHTVHEDSLSGIAKDLKHLLFRHRQSGLVDYIYPMLDRVTTLDPYFIHPYIFGGIYVLMDTGEIDEAQKLLEKGYKNNPGRWEFPFYLGWIQWMYRGNLKNTYQYLLEAVSKPQCPYYVGYMIAWLSKNLDLNDFTKHFIEGLLYSTNNPDIKEKIQELRNNVLNNL